MARRRASQEIHGSIDTGGADLGGRFMVDFEAMEAAGRSAPFVVKSRMCQEAISRAEGSGGDLKSYLKIISAECAGKPGFIGPATPLSEAVFRLILASNNRPLSIRDIQDGLTEAWSSVIYMKDLSEDLLTRLLDRPNSYFIRRV